MTQIDELLIRVPGMGAEESRALGNEVGRLVAEALPADMGTQQIPELKIKMTAAQSEYPGSMAATIAKQVVMQIKLATLR